MDCGVIEGQALPRLIVVIAELSVLLPLLRLGLVGEVCVELDAEVELQS